MTELKTLKEITYFKRADGTPCEGHLPDVQELRQEAIKWIKELTKEINEITNDAYLYQEKEKKIGYISGQIRFAEHFFNITEEQLK